LRVYSASMRFLNINSLTLLIVIIALTACSKFQKVRKSADWKEKYEAALVYFEDKDYYRTNILLEEILPIIRGTEEAEIANFKYAYSYFYQDQFILSSHYFKTFSDVYSRSEYAMEAEYMYAYSLYLQSPEPALDQTSTYESIAALQLFINKYPYSEYSTEADKLINGLQDKLETKAYESAKLYYTIQRHKAAIVAFENFQKEYPDSDYQDDVAYYLVDAAYQFAMVSIERRQKERFEKSLQLYQKMVDKFPDSEFIKSAEKIYAETIEELTKFADLNNS
jgi:outer membrane protein assembly factor BamD